MDLTLEDGGSTQSNALLKWFIYSAVLSLIPFFWVVGLKTLRGAAWSVYEIIGHGELLLVVSAHCWTAVGEIIDARHKRTKRHLIYGAMLLSIISYSVFMYAANFGIELDDQQVLMMTFQSGILLALGVIVSILAIHSANHD